MAVTADDLLPEWRLRESFVKHAARAQLHRLWARTDGSPIDDAFASSAAAASFEEIRRSERLPPLNAVRLHLEGEDRVRVTTPDATISAGFVRSDDPLPKLVALDTSATAIAPEHASTHRARSTVHYFIGLVEHPARDPRPFRELMAERFSLGYTPDPITDVAALEAWIRGALSSVVASEHVIHAIDVTEDGGNKLYAEVRMTSQALFPDGSGAISRNTQRWTLHDTTGERFARVERIGIARDAVEFFGPAPLYGPRQRP